MVLELDSVCVTPVKRALGGNGVESAGLRNENNVNFLCNLLAAAAPSALNRYMRYDCALQESAYVRASWRRESYCVRCWYT
jgi:hypothetical protein